MKSGLWGGAYWLLAAVMDGYCVWGCWGLVWCLGAPLVAPWVGNSVYAQAEPHAFTPLRVVMQRQVLDGEGLRVGGALHVPSRSEGVLSFVAHQGDEKRLCLFFPDGRLQWLSQRGRVNLEGDVAWNPCRSEANFLFARDYKVYLGSTVGRPQQERELGSGKQPQFTPDCRGMIYVGNELGNSDLFWAQDIQGESAKHVRLTSNELLDEDPVFSPDGRYVAYTEQYSGKPESRYRIAIIRVDEVTTKAAEIIRLEKDGSQRRPSWSPDGRFIAYYEHGDAGKVGIGVAAVESSGHTVLSLRPLPTKVFDVVSDYAVQPQWLLVRDWRETNTALLLVFTRHTPMATRMIDPLAYAALDSQDGLGEPMDLPIATGSTCDVSSMGDEIIYVSEERHIWLLRVELQERWTVAWIDLPLPVWGAALAPWVYRWVYPDYPWIKGSLEANLDVPGWGYGASGALEVHSQVPTEDSVTGALDASLQVPTEDSVTGALDASLSVPFPHSGSGIVELRAELPGVSASGGQLDVSLYRPRVYLDIGSLSWDVTPPPSRDFRGGAEVNVQGYPAYDDRLRLGISLAGPLPLTVAGDIGLSIGTPATPRLNGRITTVLRGPVLDAQKGTLLVSYLSPQFEIRSGKIELLLAKPAPFVSAGRLNVTVEKPKNSYTEK